MVAERSREKNWWVVVVVSPGATWNDAVEASHAMTWLVSDNFCTQLPDLVHPSRCFQCFVHCRIQLVVECHNAHKNTGISTAEIGKNCHRSDIPDEVKHIDRDGVRTRAETTTRQLFDAIGTQLEKTDADLEAKDLGEQAKMSKEKTMTI